MILTSVFCLHLTGVTVADECWNREGGGQTVTGNYNYPSGWFPEFQYDPNNPDEIDRNNSVTISVIGGFPPYTWSVSGNGFSLSLDETEGLSNALYADSTSCGSATITVTDDYGATVTGYVRCTTGQWVLKSNDCGLSGSVANFYDWESSTYNRYFFELISGNKKQYQETNTGNISKWGCCAKPILCEQCYTDKGITDLGNCIDGYFSDHGGCSESTNWMCPVFVGDLKYYEWECE